jgi:Zinc carboxypeptidase
VPYPSKVTAIDQRLTDLATQHSAICTRIDPDTLTWEGRPMGYLRIGTGTGGGRPRILIVAGIHARELAPPDAVLTFVAKLLDAYQNQVPVVYEKFVDTRPADHNIIYKRFTIPFSPDVQQIIEKTELYVMPMANPDGRVFVEAPPPKGFAFWRKNRRPAPGALSCAALPPDPRDPLKRPVPNDGAGVDLNRNFDVAWDFRNFYSDSFLSTITQGPLPSRPGGLGVSEDPCTFVFHGPPASTPPSPISRTREPETQNIINIITENKINFYMDVHSDAGQILFPWSMAQNQETSPGNSFQNTDLDKPSGLGRDPLASPDPYGEWVPPGVGAQHQALGNLMRDKIMDSTGFTAADEASPNPLVAKIAKEARKNSRYCAIQSLSSFCDLDDQCQLNAATCKPVFEPGGSDDFAFSQQIGKNPGSPITAKGLDPVFAFTFECGRREDGGFQPRAATEYPKVEREVGKGLATFLAFAAGQRGPVPAPPPGPSPTP